MKTPFIAAVLVAGLAVLAAGCYGRHAKDPAKTSEAVTKHLAKKLDLNEEQQAKVLPLARALVDERLAWRGEGAKAVGELKAQFNAGSFDAKALNVQAQAREKKLTVSRDLVVQKLAEFHAILTPEQRVKAAGLLERLEQRWHKRAHKHGPH